MNWKWNLGHAVSLNGPVHNQMGRTMEVHKMGLLFDRAAKAHIDPTRPVRV